MHGFWRPGSRYPIHVASLATPYFSVPAGRDALHVSIPKLLNDSRRNESHEAVINSLLDSSESWIISRVGDLERPGIRLNLGLQKRSSLLRGNNLHIYAIALADRIRELTGRQFNSVKLTKQHSELSMLSVAEAIPDATLSHGPAVTLITRRSYGTPAFSHEVYDATHDIRNSAAQGTPLRMYVSYVTGLPRTWSRLWQPTISAVCGVGSGRPSIDIDQIVELDLDHMSIGERLGHSVQLTISTARAPLECSDR